MKHKLMMKKKFKKFKISFNILILALVILNLFLLDLAFFDNSFIEGIKTSISAKVESSQRNQIFEEINPSNGYSLNVPYLDLGPRMISLGVIDLDKFKSAGQLTDGESNILTKGSSEKIKVTRENSHFLLNFFWALGLATNSKMLTEGQMQKYGGDPGNFASTGGWTLGRGNAMEYYSKSSLINLTPDQENLVEEVASQIYRPCCDNSTAFPDCNHGMALLGVLELMASKGATEAQMFEAAKYLNAFWFPQNYFDLAIYFKDKEGKDFSQVDAKIILGKDYSSASGYGSIKKWLDAQNGAQKTTGQGASCGVQ